MTLFSAALCPAPPQNQTRGAKEHDANSARLRQGNQANVVQIPVPAGVSE
jgi:hypothetical protein